MVIAKKDKDRVVVGINISDQLSYAAMSSYVLEDNIPFWKVKGEKNCYVFCDNAGFAVNLLRYNDYVFKGITDVQSVAKNVIPKMRELLEKNDLIIRGKEWFGKLLIVKDNKIFTIENYFVLSETNAIALNDVILATGCIEECEGKSAKESVLYTLRVLEKATRVSSFPAVVFDSKTKRKTIYYK